MKHSAAPSPTDPKSDKSRGRAVAPRNEGQRLLCQLGVTMDDIADAVGCARSTAQTWRTGEQTPSPAMRGKLYGAYGIPSASWGLEPGEAAGELPEPSIHSISSASTLEECLALHSEIKRARNGKNLTAGERVRLSDTASRVLALRHRLEEAAAMSETRIITEHPRWQAVKKAISRVAAGCPRCSKLMLEELTRLDV